MGSLQVVYLFTTQFMDISNLLEAIASYPRFEISVNMDISVLEFYGDIINISGYFDKNINRIKIVQNS